MYVLTIYLLTFLYILSVIYRGRHYNTFTLHPMEEGSGLGKFRQLIALLVKQSAVAFVPLRNNSTMFLLPMSEFTESLGLVNYSPETMDSDPPKHSSKMWKNFLHVIIITPKAMSSKINGKMLIMVKIISDVWVVRPAFKTCACRP